MAHLVLTRLVRKRQHLTQLSNQLVAIASGGLGTTGCVGRAAALLLLASTAVAARGRGGRPEAVAWWVGVSVGVRVRGRAGFRARGLGLEHELEGY